MFLIFVVLRGFVDGLFEHFVFDGGLFVVFVVGVCLTNFVLGNALLEVLGWKCGLMWGFGCFFVFWLLTVLCFLLLC